MTPEQAVLSLLSTILPVLRSETGICFEGKVFLAGGAVRDEIMGVPVKDIDLVIPMENGGIEFAICICKAFHVYSPANPVIFPRFGTAKFNLRGVEWDGIDLSNVDIECVMTRTEVYEDGSRKPEVAFGDLKEDAMRRDFTVNSLMQDLTTGEILDLTGMGRQDIDMGIIRSAIDPNIIFKEDQLRMLRAVRFAAKYNWTLPWHMKSAIMDNAPNIHKISTERVHDELVKMLLIETPSTAIQLLHETRLLFEILPAVFNMYGIGQNKFHNKSVFGHTMKVLDGTPPNLVTRLAALFHDIGKPMTKSEDETGVHFYRHDEVGAEMTRNILTRLKFDNATIDAVVTIVANHMRLKHAGFDGEGVTDKALRKLQADIGPLLPKLLEVMHADNGAHADKYNMPDQIPRINVRLRELKELAPKVVLPINGHDVMQELGITPGPRIKEALAKVQDAWFENPNLTRAEALQLIKE